ncbi:MAG: hypothetical protein AAB508_00250 [Patescibacteria group bacterium]
MKTSETLTEYEKAKQAAYTYYLQIKPVFCPHLKQNVSFNGKGFWHIVFRSQDKKREESGQILRFRLLSKSVKLVSHTATLQEYDSYTGELPVRDHGKKIIKVITLDFYGYIAIIDGWKIKVIVRKDGNGKPYFWSVIPNWVTNKKRDGKYLHFTGDLKED